MTTPAPEPVGAVPRGGHLVATGSLITVAFAGSVVVTPLYSSYESRFGFSQLTLTLVYAAYVIGNVVALLAFGQLSDQLGRKRVAYPGLLVAAASAAVFLLAQDTAWLFVGRVLIGLAVGMLSGTAAAWLVDLAGPERGPAATLAATTANMTGIALGPAVSGLLAQYVPGPLVTPFVVYLVALAVVGVAVARVPEPLVPSVHRLRDVRVRVRLGVPADRLRAFAAPAVTGFVVFALGGLYFALIPSIVIRDLRIDDLAAGGLVVFVLGAVAVAGLVLGRAMRPEPAMITGLSCLVPAAALVVVAQGAASLPLLLVAAALAGATLSFGYRGSLQVVNGIAPPQRRAEMASTYFIACFLGNSVPVIGVGVLTVAVGPLRASEAFAIVLVALAVCGLAWHLAGSGRTAPG